MADQSPAAAANADAANPERVAWIVLLGAFVCFCVLTISIAFGVYRFLFQSTVALPVSLEVAIGTVGITGVDMIEAVERDRRDLTDTAASISTDAQSQSTMQFYDLADDDEQPPLLAAVTLRGNTFLTFESANTPRFDWSQLSQRIQFASLRGALDILVTGAGARSLQMDIYTAEHDGGVHVQLLAKGRYRLSASEDEVRLLSLSGRGTARFLGEAGLSGSARAGQELVLRLGSRSVSQQDTLQNVLTHPTFSLGEPVVPRADSAAAPPGWECLAPPGQTPPGTYSRVDFEGRQGMRLRRVNQARSNGEVRCWQSFPGGLDVSDSDTMRILATFS
ncbi:MAG: hypothetical protein OXF90_03390, partial [Chloroflexi bacterium]|nr:hypothetical protein [Chloroflexota bacterium]